MRNQNFNIVCFVILFITVQTFGGSYFQSSLLGDFYHFPQADYLGRGGSSIAIADPISISSINPAGIIFTQITRLSGDFYHDSYDISANDKSGTLNYSNLHGVRLAVPIITNKFAVSIGIRPITRSNYTASAIWYTSDDHKHEDKKIIKGGLNQFSFGTATAIKDRIFAGVFLNYNFGRMVKEWDIDFVSDVYSDANIDTASTVWGAGITGGLIIKVIPELYIGAIYSRALNLNMNIYNENSLGMSEKTLGTKMEIPHTFGLGASYTLKNKLRFSFDYFNQPWAELKINNKAVDLSDSYFLSTGLEILPSTEYSAAYFKKITYRIGFYYRNDSSQHITGKEIKESLGTFGLGIPFYGPYGRIDMGFGFGTRGDLNTNNAEESIFKFMISVSGGEKWFVRARK